MIEGLEKWKRKRKMEKDTETKAYVLVKTHLEDGEEEGTGPEAEEGS